MSENAKHEEVLNKLQELLASDEVEEVGLKFELANGETHKFEFDLTEEEAEEEEAEEEESEEEEEETVEEEEEEEDEDDEDE
ncbi:hypothetical protein [Guptibacillus hwajinpoensis]|uniref:Fe-S cluster assembly iron-binding protein IscA n=1 Tax=Guptibacillus hwajinpoensis TaxID=208199 RepID=A0ABU0K213_9BACL|nr:hypothetical protein [Alkalihalobacillus hemicentroti]MDQ0483393.1 Fe-S cluster assembly iron-binding protein IscA [Alkalihalobacillus hemicentroti]